MAFNAIDNTRVNAAKHQDDWYAAEVVAGKEIPYASVSAACAAIPGAVRMKGRACIVTVGGLTVEHWWKDDLTDSGLIVKTVDISGKADVSALNNEITNRTNADNTLDGKIATNATAITNEIANRNTAIGVETTNRTIADSTLDSKIITEITRATGIESGLQSAISSAQNSITTNTNEIPKSVDYGLNLKGVAAQNYIQSATLIGQIPKGVYKGKFYTVGNSAVTPTDNPPLVAFNAVNGRITFDQALDADEDVWVLYSQLGNTSIIPSSVVLAKDNKVKLTTLTAFSPSVNLFDVNSDLNELGKALNTDGTRYTASGFNTTHPITVAPSQSIAITKSNLLAYYDSSDVLIGSVITTTSAVVRVAPALTDHIRVTFLVADWPLAMVSFNTEQVSYVSFNDVTLKQTALPILPLNKFANDSLTSAKLAKYTLEHQKTKFFTISKNLFNPNDLNNSLGRALIANGNTNVNALYNTTSFIPVSAGASLALTKSSLVAFYDSNFTLLGSVITTNSPHVRVAPTSTAYIRVSLLLADWPLFMISVNTIQVPYTSYDNVKLKDELLEIQSGAITPIKTSFFDASKNLFNPNDSGVELGKTFNNTGISITNAAFNNTGFIPMGAGVSLAITPSRFIVYYDSDFTIIGAVINNNDLARIRVTPAGTAFIRVSTLIANWSGLMISIGTSQTDYVSYDDRKINANYLPVARHRFYGKKWMGYGDSLTAIPGYLFGYTVDKIGCTFINKGVSGEMANQITDRLLADLAADPNLLADVDLLTYFATTNDYANNRDIGTMDSGVVSNKSMRAIQEAIKAVFIAKPSITMALITPIRTYRPDFGSFDAPNALGFRMGDYANAIKTVGLRYDVPVLDLYSFGGRNELNYLQVTNGSDGVHPNPEQAKRLGENTVYHFLNQIY